MQSNLSEFKEWNLENILELVEYNPYVGSLSYRKNSKVISPDPEGFCVLSAKGFKPASKKFKMDKLIWLIISSKSLEKDERILHKNLDKNDNRLVNLSIVTREEYLEIYNANRNLDGGIRYVQHPNDQYCFRVYWFEGSSEKSKVVQDVVTAKRLEQKLRFKYMKILTKYCLFED